MVPEGWRELQLKQLLSFKNGFNTSKEHYGGGIKFVNVMDVFNNERLCAADIIGSVEADEKQASNYSVKHGDVLFNRTSEIPNEIALSTTFLDDDKTAIFGGFVIRGRPKSSDLTPEYSVYCFQASRYRKEAIRRSQGAVRSNIGQKDLEQIVILLPPCDEQKQIAEVLDSWNHAIETTEKLIENSKAQKKALMQQLLTGKTRLPEFGGAWSDRTLETVADVRVSPVNKKSVDGEPHVRLCNYTDVYYNSRITSKLDFMPATASPKEVERFTLQLNDVVITKDSETPSDIAVPALVGEQLDNVVCGYHLAIIRPAPEHADGAFLNHLFSLPKIKHYFSTRANGATRFGLSIDGIRRASLTLPKLKEQQAIASLLNSCDAETESLTTLYQKLNTEKRALMQQLLTGKRRVKVPA